MARKPVWADWKPETNDLAVLCDDGTVWSFTAHDQEWSSWGPPLPGSEADVKRTGQETR